MSKSCPACGSIFEDDLNSCPHDGFELMEYASGDPLVGKLLDSRFRIDEVLGAGGMGQVYRARQVSVDRDVAVKVMRAEYSIDDEVRERFFREARVVSSLNHPNIVQLIDFGRDAETKRLFLAMEFIDGVDLREIMNRGNPGPHVIIAIARQVLSALAEAHASGVVHRDLKPENLMIVTNADGGFQTKVLDFGIAYSAASEKRLTSTGAVMGTPHYMAPEQAGGTHTDQRTDLYALGIILYEMLSGRIPFDGDSALQIIMRRATEPLPPLAASTDLSTQRLSSLITSMLARTPEDRPSNAREIIETLDSIRMESKLSPVRCFPADPDPFKDWFQSAASHPHDQAAELPTTPLLEIPEDESDPEPRADPEHEFKTTPTPPTRTVWVSAAVILGFIVLLGIGLTTRTRTPPPEPTADSAESLSGSLTDEQADPEPNPQDTVEAAKIDAPVEADDETSAKAADTADEATDTSDSKTPTLSAGSEQPESSEETSSASAKKTQPKRQKSRKEPRKERLEKIVDDTRELDTRIQKKLDRVLDDELQERLENLDRGIE